MTKNHLSFNVDFTMMKSEILFIDGRNGTVAIRQLIKNLLEHCLGAAR